MPSDPCVYPTLNHTIDSQNLRILLYTDSIKMGQPVKECEKLKADTFQYGDRVFIINSNVH